jgi:hypothetical protein
MWKLPDFDTTIWQKKQMEGIEEGQLKTLKKLKMEN